LEAVLECNPMNDQKIVMALDDLYYNHVRNEISDQEAKDKVEQLKKETQEKYYAKNPGLEAQVYIGKDRRQILEGWWGGRLEDHIPGCNALKDKKTMDVLEDLYDSYMHTTSMDDDKAKQKIKEIQRDMREGNQEAHRPALKKFGLTFGMKGVVGKTKK